MAVRWAAARRDRAARAPAATEPAGRTVTDDGSDPPGRGREAEAGNGEGTDRASPSDEEIVRTASDAAEGVVFSRYAKSDVRDLDVTARFEDGVLSVDVYLDAPADGGTDPEQVADDAALAARGAVDELFAPDDDS